MTIRRAGEEERRGSLASGKAGVVNGRPERVAAPERYVDARELAELMGVSVSTVKRWVKAGMPSETWRLKRTRRFLPSAAMNWAASSTKVSPTTTPAQRSELVPGGSTRRE